MLKSLTYLSGVGLEFESFGETCYTGCSSVVNKDLVVVVVFERQ